MKPHEPLNDDDLDTISFSILAVLSVSATILWATGGSL